MLKVQPQTPFYKVTVIKVTVTTNTNTKTVTFTFNKKANHSHSERQENGWSEPPSEHVDPHVGNGGWMGFRCLL